MIPGKFIKLGIIVFIVVLITVSLLVVWMFFFRKAKLTISTKQTDITLKVNNQEYIVNGGQTIQMTPGEKKIVAHKEGYHDSGYTITLEPNQEISLAINLIPLVPTKFPTNLKAGNVDLDDSYKDYTVTKIEYFESGLWAIVILQGKVGGLEPVVAIMRLEDNQWLTVAGPGTSFEKQDMRDIPPEAFAYLRKNGYLQ